MPRQHIGDAYVRIHANGERVRFGIREAFSQADADVSEAGQRHGESYARQFAVRMNQITARNQDTGFRRITAATRRFRATMREVENFHRTVGAFSSTQNRFFNRFASNMDRAADGLGHLFGRGSRNDFLNFTGSLVRGFVRIGSLVPRTLGLIQGVATGLVQTVGLMASSFTQARAAGAGLFRALLVAGRVGAATLASSIASAGAFLGGFAILAVGVVSILGPLVSGLFLLGGAITAVALTLGGGLLGGIAALFASLAPLTLGFGGLALAISGLNKQQKKAITESFKPLKNTIDGLADAAAQPLFANLDQQVRRINPVLQRMEPLARAAGVGMRSFFDELITAMNSGAVDKFTTAFSRELPGLLRRMGSITGNLFEGLAGTFRAMIPLLDRFFGWLDRITGEFADFANSARGQRELKQFFEDVGDSAESLGDLVSETFDLLGNLFNLGGNEAGIGILDSFTGKIRDLNQFLTDNPDAVGEWFADSKEFIEDVGAAVLDLIELFDEFDTPTNRDRIMAFFEGLGTAIDAVTTAVGFIQDGIDKISELGDKVARFEGKIGGAGDATNQFFTDLPGRIEQFANDMRSKVSGAWDDVKERARDAWQSVKDGASQAWANVTQTVSGAIQTVRERLGDARDAAISLPFQILAALTSIPGLLADAIVAAPKVVGRVVDRIAGFFQRLPGRIGGFMGRVVGDIVGFFRPLPGRLGALVGRAVSSVVGFFQRLPGRVTGALAGLAVRIAGQFQRIAAPINRVVDNVVGFFRAMPGRVLGLIASLPVRFGASIGRMVGQAARVVDSVLGFFRSLPAKAIGFINSLPSRFVGIIQKLPPDAQRAIGTILGNFQALPGDVGRALGSIVGTVGNIFGNIVDAVRNVPGDIAALFSGLGSRIASAIGSINIPRPNIPDIPGIPDPFATGGLVRGRTFAMIGEAGPEAVVPLNRPLSQVDPAVRWLSAIAQGKGPVPMASGGVAGASRTIEVGGITVVSPQSDPRAVAAEVVNHLVAVGY